MYFNIIPLQEAAPQGGGFSGIIMIVLLLVVFWFFMIRPQQKEQKKINKFRDELKKGDKVIVGGGIYGTVNDIRENTILVDVTKGVTITVTKAAVYPDANAAGQQQAK